MRHPDVAGAVPAVAHDDLGVATELDRGNLERHPLEGRGGDRRLVGRLVVAGPVDAATLAVGGDPPDAPGGVDDLPSRTEVALGAPERVDRPGRRRVLDGGGAADRHLEPVVGLECLAGRQPPRGGDDGPVLEAGLQVPHGAAGVADAVGHPRGLRLQTGRAGRGRRGLPGEEADEEDDRGQQGHDHPEAVVEHAVRGHGHRVAPFSRGSASLSQTESATKRHVNISACCVLCSKKSRLQYQLSDVSMCSHF